MILKPSKNWGPYFLRSLVCYGHRLSKILWQIWTQQDHWTLQYIKYYGSFGKYIAWHEIIAFPWSLITKVRRNLSLHFRKIYDHLWKTRDTAKTETIFESETFCVCHALLGQLVSVALTRVAEIKSHWHGAQPVAALATQRFPEQAIWDLGGHTHGGWRRAQKPRRDEIMIVLPASSPIIIKLVSSRSLFDLVHKAYKAWLIKLAHKNTNLILLNVLLKLMLSGQAS